MRADFLTGSVEDCAFYVLFLLYACCNEYAACGVYNRLRRLSVKFTEALCFS